MSNILKFGHGKMSVFNYEWTKEDKAQFAKMRIVIVSPIMYPEPKWTKSLVNAVAYSWLNGLKVLCMGIADKVVVDWARNDLADNAYHMKCEYDGKHFTHIFWTDADHIFNPDVILHLAKHFKNKEIDGVSALYYARSGPCLPVAMVKDESADDYMHYPIVIVPNQLVEVDAFGFGCCLMKRDIFGRVPKPWFTIDWRGGEDIVFCRKAKKHGVRWFVDGQYKIGHIGSPQIITEETYKKHLEDNPDTYADRVKIALGGVKVK